MKKQISIFLFFVIGAFGWINLSAAEQYSPEDIVLITATQIKDSLKDLDTGHQDDAHYLSLIINDMLIPHVDLDRVSVLVLGKYWKRTTPEQKAEFQQEFKKMLTRTYSAAFADESDWVISIISGVEKKKGRIYLLRTKVDREGQTLKVDYMMSKKDSAWKIYDVKVEGMSLITNYRSTFSRIIKADGMHALLTKMHDMNEKVQRNMNRS